MTKYILLELRHNDNIDRIAGDNDVKDKVLLILRHNDNIDGIADGVTHHVHTLRYKSQRQY